MVGREREHRRSVWGSSRATTSWLLCGVFALTLVVHARALQNGFIDLDDDVYVTQNARVLGGLTPAGIRWAFTTTDGANWHPLTWISHMADVELFGRAPAGHHATSIVLHAVAAGILFLALCLMTGEAWPSALVAVCFSVHPLRVESVTWIAERKDVLSGVFWMCSMLAYGWYARRPSATRYALVLASFVLGLLAKPMLVSLPFVLLLLDVWPLGRSPTFRGLVLEKLPLFGLAAASSAVTVVAQRAGGAVGGLNVVSFPERVVNAVVSTGAYLLDFFLPVGLGIFYPHPFTIHSDAWARILLPASLCLVILAGVTYVALRSLQTRPYLAVGWLWYLGTLVPVLGLVQVGAQARADRYTYIPLIGVGIAVAWSVRDWIAARPPIRSWAIVTCALAIAASATATWIQIGHWRDSFAIYEHTLQVTRGNYFVETNLGVLYSKRGDSARAKTLFEEALPDPDAHANLGMLVVQEGDLGGARSHFEAALRARPGHVDALYGLAMVADREGNLGEARRRLEEAIRSQARSVRVLNYLGVISAKEGDLTGAQAQFRKAIQLDPDSYDAHFNLARTYSMQKDRVAAERELLEALRVRPTSKEARGGLEELRTRQR